MISLEVPHSLDVYHVLYIPCKNHGLVMGACGDLATRETTDRANLVNLIGDAHLGLPSPDQCDPTVIQRAPTGKVPHNGPSYALTSIVGGALVGEAEYVRAQEINAESPLNAFPGSAQSISDF